MSDQSTPDDGEHPGRYPAADGGVPMKDWTIERPFDSADYLDRKPPRYQGDGGAKGAAAKAAAKALKDKQKGKP